MVKTISDKLCRWVLSFDYDVRYIVYNESLKRFVLSYDSLSDGTKDVTLCPLGRSLDSTMLAAKLLIEEEFERDAEEQAKNNDCQGD